MTARLRPVMFAGTGSDVGKSIVATAFCRIFLQDGYCPAPFKAQNMALNSYATKEGLEVGRAQAVQAEAAGIDCTTDMNPLLLKPNSDHTSQVVLNGRSIGNQHARDYFRKEGREVFRHAVHEAFDCLSEKYNPIVMEGAGSIAELNLRDVDIVNMSMARHADAAVILVADINRGGVFASAYGSIMLQTPSDRQRIKGIIINKFRGDMSLFDSGRRMMEEVCGVPVLGVLPYFDDIHIDAEDSMSLAMKNTKAQTGVKNICVVRLEHISNFTDFDPLERIAGVNLYYSVDPEEILKADTVILPGTKSTIADLAVLRNNGCDKAVMQAYSRGCEVMGICGGYQMMGMEILDPGHVEGVCERIDGLGLLPLTTIMNGEKRTAQVEFEYNGRRRRGYEIHNGVTTDADGVAYRTYRRDQRCWGTYIHGFFDSGGDGSQYDMLASRVRKYVDIPRIYRILS